MPRHESGAMIARLRQSPAEFYRCRRVRKRQQAHVLAQQTPVDRLQLVFASDQWRRLWTQIVSDTVKSPG